ncbi:MAG: zf-HC2 domain-containing protein [Firmicutes bacterium]|nr:zf-HC2 domain-containing protein [Bacillota bacterium]
MTDCSIIHDILPLYHDNACSPASRALVDGHVASCGACRAQLAALDAPVTLAPAPSFLPPARRLREAKSKLVRKTALAATAIFCALAIFIAGGTLFYTQFERERVIPYTYPGMLVGAASWGPDEDGAYERISLEFAAGRYVRASCLFRRVTIDGQQRDVAILQLTQTWARKYLDTVVGGPEEVAVGTGTGLYVSRGGQKHDVAYGPEYEPAYWDPRWAYPGSLTAVYYLESPSSPLDLKDAPEESVLGALERGGHLIWRDGDIV